MGGGAGLGGTTYVTEVHQYPRLFSGRGLLPLSGRGLLLNRGMDKLEDKSSKYKFYFFRNI